MEFVKIGKIVNTFGLKGELKVDYFTDFIEERFKHNSIIYVGEDKDEFKVNKYKIHKDYLLVQFIDNEDINLVEKYKNCFIYKNKKDIKPLQNGKYYFSDLVDLDVYVNDILIGRVLRVEKGVTYNYLRIKVNGEEKLIPNIPVFVKNIDLVNQRIDINEIEGLL